MFYSLTDLYVTFQALTSNTARVAFLHQNKQFIEDNYLINVDNLIKHWDNLSN
jgi:hypothetical protein